MKYICFVVHRNGIRESVIHSAHKKNIYSQSESLDGADIGFIQLNVLLRQSFINQYSVSTYIRVPFYWWAARSRRPYHQACGRSSGGEWSRRICSSAAARSPASCEGLWSPKSGVGVSAPSCRLVCKVRTL